MFKKSKIPIYWLKYSDKKNRFYHYQRGVGHEKGGFQWTAHICWDGHREEELKDLHVDSGASYVDSNQSPTSVSDPKIYLGISGLTLHPGDAVRLYYAIVSGFSISEMLDNAQLAQAVYDSEFTVGVEDRIEIMPHSFALDQNYPNPFNPTTSIRYDIPKVSFVTLKVYNVLGQEMATLVDEKKEAGRYEVTFDGSKMASGVYDYRLQAGNYFETKKFILIK